MQLNRCSAVLVTVTALFAGMALAATTDSVRIEQIAHERCEACHGQDGQGNNAMFPKLSGQNETYLVQQMFNFKSGKRRSNVMEPQLADLSGDDIVQLARHFSQRSLKPSPTGNEALSAQGRAIYTQGNPASGVAPCYVCHGPNARGGQMLPRLAGQHAEYLELQLRRFIERSRTTDQTLMHSVASRMTEQEIQAVSHFLAGMN